MLVRLLGGDSCSERFPSQNAFRALSLMGSCAPSAPCTSRCSCGPSSTGGVAWRAPGAETMGVLGLVVGVLSLLPAVGLLLIAQSFPLCTD